MKNNSQEARRITLVLADDHVVIRRGIRKLLEDWGELEIVGEATNNLSEQLRQSHPEIPWRDAIDMRSFLIHEYFGVRTHVVWDTCKNDVPALKGFLEGVLND